MRLWLAYIFLIFNATQAYSFKNDVSDSIHTMLQHASSDSVRINILSDISRDFLTRDVKLAESFANQSLILATKTKHQPGIALALDDLGLVAEHKGDYRKSLSLYLSALRIRERSGDKKAIAVSLNNVGVTCWYMKKYELAKSYFFQGLKINEEAKDTMGVATIYGNLGIISDEEGNKEASLSYYALAMKLFESLKNEDAVASCMSNIGMIHANRDEYSKAMEAYKKALEIRSRKNDKQGIAISLNNIGFLEMRRGNYTKAISDFKASLVIAKVLDSKEDIRENLYNLSKSYAYVNRFDSAYHMLLDHMSMKDSIMNAETQASFHDLEAKYQNEKKEQQIELLKREKLLESVSQKAEVEKQKVFRNTMFGGMVMFLFAAVMIFGRYKEKQKANVLLEDKNKAINEQKVMIEAAHMQLEEKNKDITDSIRYAKRIQEAIFPGEKTFKKYLPHSFIVYKPKDIVSGDFYWMEHRKNKTYLAAVDCTGHGVPGSLMSIVGHGIIKQAVTEQNKERPADILDALNKGVTETLNQRYEDSSVKDGMDIALCCIDHANLTLEYAGAFNPLWMVRNGELREIKADKIQVGMFMGEEAKKFTNHLLHLLPGDRFYLFSDGYADQFGGPQGKKFKYKQLEKLILSVHKEDMEKQKHILEESFNSWKGNLEQIDDVMVLGFMVS